MCVLGKRGRVGMRALVRDTDGQTSSGTKKETKNIRKWNQSWKCWQETRIIFGGVRGQKMPGVYLAPNGSDEKQKQVMIKKYRDKWKDQNGAIYSLFIIKDTPRQQS